MFPPVIGGTAVKRSFEKPLEKYYFGNFWPSSPDPRQDLANSPTLRWEKGRKSFSSPSPWGEENSVRAFQAEL